MAEFVPPTPEELDALFANYEVMGFIAQGGMGAVYLGRQLSLDREVAIKVLPPELGLDASYLASFESEAKSLAKLNHGNLVGIFDFGQVNGMFFIIMEYIPGRSLYHTAHGHSVDEKEAAFLISEICKGLAHAHEHGILHRDIKPANILIDDEARPILVDFGLAKQMADRQHQGVIFGTPGYTAPEVVKNPHQVDHRADIFSVGVMLHELLTGHLPDTPYVPASKLNDTDPRFDAIIQKAMHPLGTLRYASCSEMAKALDDLIANWDKADHPQGHGTKILASAATAGGAKINPLLTPSPGAGAGSSPVLQTAAGASHPSSVSPVPAGRSVPPSLPPSLAKKSGGGAGVIIILLLILGGVIVGLVVLKNSSTSETERSDPTSLEENPKKAKDRKAKLEKQRQAKLEEKRKAEEQRRKQEEARRETEQERQRKEEQRRQAELASIRAEEEKARAEAAALLAEQNKDPINGPTAIAFNTDDFIQRGRSGVLKGLNQVQDEMKLDYLGVINDLESLAEEEVEKLPRGPRAEAEEVVEAVIKELKSKNKLPGAPPADANAAIIVHYDKALKSQEKIEQRFNEQLLIFQQKYITGLNEKISELEKTENFVEIEQLQSELDEVKTLEGFRNRIF